MGTDFRELAEYHYKKYQEHDAKAKEYRAQGNKAMAETEEQQAAHFHSCYRSAKDCI